MATMDQLNKVEAILTKSTVIICKKLDPEPLLLTMKAEGALTPDDVTLIQSEKTTSRQAEKMLNILIKKPATAYDIFMAALLEAKRKDLHDEIKVIEQEHGYVKGPAPATEPAPIEKPIPVGDTVVEPLDITDFVGELVENQLRNVYERLGISHKDVEKAHGRTKVNDPDERAKEVLRFWQHQNGKDATRGKLLKALKDCIYIDAMQKLQAKWGSPNV